MEVQGLKNVFFLTIEMETGGIIMPEINPLYSCPKYPRCSCNSCPLDVKYPRYTDEKDPEKDCRLSREVRQNISAKFPGLLRFRGLSEEEMKQLN